MSSCARGLSQVLCASLFLCSEAGSPLACVARQLPHTFLSSCCVRVFLPADVFLLVCCWLLLLSSCSPNPSGVPMVPISWQEMQCPQTKVIERRKVAKVT